MKVKVITYGDGSTATEVTDGNQTVSITKAGEPVASVEELDDLDEKGVRELHRQLLHKPTKEKPKDSGHSS